MQIQEVIKHLLHISVTAYEHWTNNKVKTLTAENSLQFLSQPEAEQQRLITLFARDCKFSRKHINCIFQLIQREFRNKLTGIFPLSLIAPAFEKHSPLDLS
jgi:hypothetical protein